MEEKQLIKLAKAGDSDAFCILYSKYKDRLYRYAFYRLGNHADAEDAVSECILCAFQEIRHLKNEKAFPAWIFRILYCSCAAIIKKQSASKMEKELTFAENELAVSFDNVIQKTELQFALDKLNDDEREIVLLSSVAGFKSGEIAKIVDLTAGSVRSKLSRSLKKMKEFLE